MGFVWFNERPICILGQGGGVCGGGREVFSIRIPERERERKNRKENIYEKLYLLDERKALP